MRADRPAPAIATLENAYRLAARVADATDQDMQVWATGEAERPFVAEPANDRAVRVVVRIVARIISQND